MKPHGQKAGAIAAVCINTKLSSMRPNVPCPVGPDGTWFAVECGTPRELSDVEDEAVNNFRFGDVPFLQKFLKQIGARA